MSWLLRTIKIILTAILTGYTYNQGYSWDTGGRINSAQVQWHSLLSLVPASKQLACTSERRRQRGELHSSTQSKQVARKHPQRTSYGPSYDECNFCLFACQQRIKHTKIETDLFCQVTFWSFRQCQTKPIHVHATLAAYTWCPATKWV